MAPAAQHRRHHQRQELLLAYLSLAEVSHSSQTPGWARAASSRCCCFFGSQTSEKAALPLEIHHQKRASFQSSSIFLSIFPVTETLPTCICSPRSYSTSSIRLSYNTTMSYLNLNILSQTQTLEFWVP